ncbi:Glucose-methanol-choline (Gmc) oxidoreductase [Rasamsonia emersonii CBS 393.64]|uniref:Glucose-methanol-choline (Gmc) oxidoreductase n=1 Tax=Rasamsonia emersonii (strain ATCC 16479 / CBS 393.64 / IMI 116815) TaxID=1408163 RepID=A0A0F4Z5T4_RASE3|nr:Glucose-methanol-choline (Gmc) oxidoreductase [Rasamsonia emersonii CBS 393.64]KKA25461.1 Glucose-methanol-choline (Gmc) oxidoreductase [Rasamsonia emersonii CBS 393.64]
MASTFDFIVVGSGPAGSVIASGLARTPKSPKVLLLEAGGKNDDRNLRVDGQRWLTFQNKPMNFGYKTTAQENLNNREIDYSRGKGIGGSSAINFGVYSVGARDDYEEWARIVGDDDYRWEHIQARYKSLETFHGDIPPGVDKKYAAPKASDHGSSGPLHVGFAAEWERDLPPLLDVFEQAGFPLNPDHNSGNPIGMSVLINSAYKGVRSTAGDLLASPPENLTIVTDAPVQRVILEGKKAVGVESNGKKYFASKEVILSAGALDAPRILMHSGIGPAEQLEKYNIPVVHNVPAIGKGLRDHSFIPLVYTRKDNSTDRAAFFGDQKAMDDALEQWKREGTGPWAKFACELGVGWFKLDRLVASKEFQELPAEEKNYLLQETVPHYEILTHFPVHWFIPNFPKDALSYSCLLVFLYNAQSRGEVTLQSSDPNVPLRFDPKFLTHPFDRRAAIESLRDAFRIAKHDAYTKDNVAEMVAPKSDSDEDLLEYWRQNMSSSWHMTGTVKMGKPGDADAAVDNNFRLMGIEGLRVADMSVVPVLASCHVQAVAYVTGATCAEKLIKEYNLA